MDRDQLTGLPIGELVEGGEATWPEHKSLQGRYVRLEPLDPLKHGYGLWQAVGGMENAALWQYLSEGPFATRPSFDEALAEAASLEDPAFFAIIDQVTNDVVGRVALLNIRPKHRSIEVGHLLFSRQLQKTRGATEAMYLLAKYSFEKLGYRRYEWKCNVLNAKSLRAAERLGFVFEGIFRQHMIIKQRNRDTAWFSILDSEWPEMKQAMERWLSPDNFDEQGHQRQSLSGLTKSLAHSRRPQLNWRD